MEYQNKEKKIKATFLLDFIRANKYLLSQTYFHYIKNNLSIVLCNLMLIFRRNDDPDDDLLYYLRYYDSS